MSARARDPPESQEIAREFVSTSTDLAAAAVVVVVSYRIGRITPIKSANYRGLYSVIAICGRDMLAQLVYIEYYNGPIRTIAS